VNVQDLDKMERMIWLIEIGLTVGKNLVLIMALFMGISFLIAAYFAIVGNIVGSVISLAFGIAGLVFLAQIMQTRRRHNHRHARYRDTRQQYQEYREARAA